MEPRRRELAQRRKCLGLTQEGLAGLLGVERSTVVRWERGEREPQPWIRPKLARGLQISLEHLDRLLAGADESSHRMGYIDDRDSGIALRTHPDPTEIDDMKRRELLRLFSMAGTVMALPSAQIIDVERVSSAADPRSRPDAALLGEYAQLNTHLWRVFALTDVKGQILPLVLDQLGVLSDQLSRVRSQADHRSLCGLAADLFQLAGELFFDGDRYTSAAHCYTLAATAGKEAGAFDLWACALTRHAFISVYERRFTQASPMLELAAAVARRGDGSSSTRHWVAAVQAENFAGLGDLSACQRALDAAAHVQGLKGSVHNGGWLRFDGSRLAEERGTCYTALGRDDLAESVLTDALSGSLTIRRKASVLTDLAMLGVRRRDPDQVVTYVDTALAAARRTGSRVIGRKLHGLQPHLEPLLAHSQVRRIDADITALFNSPSING
ncbi:helix-turn-helix transcriptional regulator [Nocardiopsis mangrovi]|uniref:Helix-turn-helix transcriptional regulator n=1 Tax=Nocardiopsis mangrovi TaxID=1179818 RepID=A0ABV9DR94_9ACTN